MGTGVTSIWTLVFISYDRYNIICNGFQGPKLTQGKAGMMVLFTWVIGIGMALGPFFGWGKYIPEGILDSWSYNLSMIIFDFSVPCSIIIFSYVFIVKAIFQHEAAMRAQAKKMNVTNLRSNEAETQRAEIRIAKTACANVALWLVCWSPYACITIQGVS